MKHRPNPEQEPRLTREQLAARWQVSAMTLHRWRNSGRLPAMKLGRSVRFKLSDVERFERDALVSNPSVIDVTVTHLA